MNVGHMLEELTILVHRRRCSAAEAAEVNRFFSMLAAREASGELTEEQARALIIRFGVRKLQQRQAS